MHPVYPVVKNNRRPLLGQLVSDTDRHVRNVMFNGPPLQQQKRYGC